MLCALDYERPDTVTVNDLVYTRGAAGWELHKSSYRKLRIGPDWLCEQDAAGGLDIAHHSPAANGMVDRGEARMRPRSTAVIEREGVPRYRRRPLVWSGSCRGAPTR